MKSNYSKGTFLLFIAAVVLGATEGCGFGQPFFFNTQSGNWNQGATWGNSGNVAGTDYPSGAGGIVIQTGTVTITDPENVHPILFVIENGNELVIANDGSLSVNGVSNALALGNGAGGTLDIQSGGNFTGTLGVAATGTNTLILGDGVEVGGTVEFAGNNAVLTAEVDSNDHATISGQLQNFPIDSIVLQKTGTGTLALTNPTNLYDGGTQILQGTVEAGSNGALGTGDVTVELGSALSLSGGITIANNITISGTGVGGAGALIALNNSINTANGNVTLAADATVGMIDSDNAKLVFNGTLALGAHTLTVSYSSNPSRESIVFLNGLITGTGGLTVANNAVVEMQGGTPNTYTGDTTVQAGSSLYLANLGTAIEGNLNVSGEVVSNGFQLSSNSVVTLSGDGQLVLTLFAHENIAGLISTSRTTLVTLGLVTGSIPELNLTGSGTYTFAGEIADSGGSGPLMTLVKTGSGTEILSGVNFYRGGTTVSGGVLQLGDGSTTGARVGTGAVTVNGTGTFTLDLAQGETFSNAIHDNHAVILDDAPSSDYNVASVIDGNGTVSKSGANSVVLTGASTYTGGTFVTDGTLQVGDGFTTGASVGTGDVTVNGSGTFTLNLAQGETFSNAIHDYGFLVLDDSPSSDYTVSSVIDGSGNVTKAGGNTVTLTNANSYSGGTFVYGGTLVVGNANALGTGPVVIVSTLATNSTVHGMTINVGGDFTDAGVVRLAIFAPNDFDSIHLTNAGSVAHLNGSLVLAVPADVAAVAGHTYDVITSSNGVQGQFSSVTTTLPSIGATVAYTNNAEITLQLTQLPFATLGAFSANELAIARNVDLNAQNTTSGTLNSLVSSLNAISATPNALASAFDQLSPQKFGQFTSTTAAANASFGTQMKDNYLAGRRGGANGTFALGNGSIDSSALTLNDPSYDPTLAMVHSRMMAWNPGPLGAISDSGALLGGVDMKSLRGSGTDQLGGPDACYCVPAVYDNPWNFYIAGNVVLAQGFSQNDVSHFDSNTESVTLGTDYRLTPNFLIGLAAGYGHTDATLDNDGSSATVDSYSPGFYASYADHGWYANLSGDYIHNAYTQSRVIGFLGQTANSAPEGNEGVANLDGGYDFHLGKWTAGPLAGLQYTHLTVDGYSESGSDADLSVNSQNADSLRSRLGGRVSFTYSHCGINFTPHLDASWQHEFLDQARGITSQFTGAVGSFSVKTTNPGRDSALVDLGLDAEINRTVTVFGDYEIQAGQENYFGQSIQGGVKIGF